MGVCFGPEGRPFCQHRQYCLLLFLERLGAEAVQCPLGLEPGLDVPLSRGRGPEEVGQGDPKKGAMKPAASTGSRRSTLWESGVWWGVSDPTEGYLHAGSTPPLDLKCGEILQWILGSLDSQGLVES